MNLNKKVDIKLEKKLKNYPKIKIKKRIIILYIILFFYFKKIFYYKHNYINNDELINKNLNL